MAHPHLSGTFSELHAAGCIQTGSDVHSDVADAFRKFGLIFHGLMDETAKRFAKTRFSDEGREGMTAALEARRPGWAST